MLMVLQRVQVAFISKHDITIDEASFRPRVLSSVLPLSLLYLQFAKGGGRGYLICPCSLAIHFLWKKICLPRHGSFHLVFFFSAFVGCFVFIDV